VGQLVSNITTNGSEDDTAAAAAAAAPEDTTEGFDHGTTNGSDLQK
jgi:hypothetical protein